MKLFRINPIIISFLLGFLVVFVLDIINSEIPYTTTGTSNEGILLLNLFRLLGFFIPLIIKYLVPVVASIYTLKVYAAFSKKEKLFAAGVVGLVSGLGQAIAWVLVYAITQSNQLTTPARNGYLNQTNDSLSSSINSLYYGYGSSAYVILSTILAIIGISFCISLVSGSMAILNKNGLRKRSLLLSFLLGILSVAISAGIFSFVSQTLHIDSIWNIILVFLVIIIAFMMPCLAAELTIKPLSGASTFDKITAGGTAGIISGLGEIIGIVTVVIVIEIITYNSYPRGVNLLPTTSLNIIYAILAILITYANYILGAIAITGLIGSLTGYVIAKRANGLQLRSVLASLLLGFNLVAIIDIVGLVLTRNDFTTVSGVQSINPTVGLGAILFYGFLVLPLPVVTAALALKPVTGATTRAMIISGGIIGFVCAAGEILGYLFSNIISSLGVFQSQLYIYSYTYVAQTRVRSEIFYLATGTIIIQNLLYILLIIIIGSIAGILTGFVLTKISRS